MPKPKVYSCCICHKVFEDTKPIRLVKQKYGASGYHQYSNVASYDFCERCFKPIDKFINKYKEEN